MAEYFTGTLLASPIVRGSSGDTYGTHHSILGVGGFMEVNDIAERNALPVDTVNGINYDGISSGQRRIGMLVYVHSDDTTYKLTIDKSTWDGLTTNQKLTALANNSNWTIFIAGGDDVPVGDRILKQFEQITHGFVVGDVIGYDGTDFIKVSSLTAANIEPLGIVTKVTDVNTFNLTFSGYLPSVTFNDVNSNPISGGTVYYLSSTAGKITPINPTSPTEISKPILVGLSGNTGMVLQYRGLYDMASSGSTVSYEDFTGYTATTQIFLDKVVTGATNIGFFSGLTGIQTLPIDHLTDNSFDGNYVSLYNYYYRDNQGYIRIGAASDGLPRRGYLRSTTPSKSWIWNEYFGDGASLGWIFVNADVSSDSVYGTQLTGSSNIEYDSPQYTLSAWSANTFYNNGSSIVINNVIGTTTTGDTYFNTGPIYNDKVDKEIRLRTILSKTPQSLKVEYDDYFIKLSGHSAVTNINNVGSGTGIVSGSSGTTVLLKSLVGGGDTTIIDNGDTITISSTGGGGVTGSFENVTKRISQVGHGFLTNDVIGWSGGTYNKAIADGSYNGEVVGIVSNVVNPDTFDLTQSGYITGLTGLIANNTYYLSTSVAGGLTTSIPINVGEFIRPVIITNSTTSGWVLPYQGDIIEAPVTGGTGSTIYSGKSPATIDLGGISSGTVLTGRTLQDIIEELLVVTINPTFINPNNSFSDDASSTYEVGTVLNINFTAGFTRGSILLDGAFQNYRSGLPNTYYYSGDGLPSSVPSTSLSDNQTVNNYEVSAGTATWSSCVGYDGGPQPLDSDGNPYGSPLSSGITGAKSTNITGIYPYFYGTEASGGAPAGSNRPAATNTLVNGGTKVVANSNGTLNISFNSTADDYIWFAIPSTSTSKTSWYVDILNNGPIGGSVSPGGNLFPDFDSVSVTTTCWSGISYKVYISNYQTAISTNMELRN